MEDNRQELTHKNNTPQGQSACVSHMKSLINTKRTNESVSTLAVVVAALVWSLAAQPALAGSDTWTGAGTDSFWEDSNNWGGTAPNPGDDLFFDTGNNLLATNNFAGGAMFQGITFNGAAGAFTLYGNPLVLGGLLQDMNGNPYGGSISNASPANETISLSVTNAAGEHAVMTAGGAGQLNLPATFVNNAGAMVQFIQLGGAINSVLPINSAGCLGGWAVYTTSGNSLINNNQNGGATVDWATTNASGALSAYGAYTNMSGNAAAVINNPTNNVKITSGGASGHDDTMKSSGTTTVNSIYWDGGGFSGSTYLDIPTGDILRLGAQGGVIANLNHYLRIGNNDGSLTAGGAANTPGQIYVYNVSGYASGQVEFWCNITDNGSSSYPVSLIFFGSAELDDANTYSGGTYVNAGDLNQNGSSDVFGYGPIYVYPGGRVDLGNQNDETLTNNFYIEGMGFVTNNQPGAIKGTYGGTLKGAITLLGNAWIDPNAGSITCTFTGPFTGTGSLSIGGPVGYYVGGTAVFDANCNYTGDTIIDATVGPGGNSGGNAAIKIGTGDNNIMNNGGNLVLSGGAATANTATFDLDGTTQTINGLWATNIIDDDSPEYSYVKSSLGGGVLVVGNNDASSTYYGNTENGSGTLGITKIGAGTVSLDWQNTYTGPTIVSNGVLYIGGISLDSSAITVVNPGLLDVSAFGAYGLGSGQSLGGNGAVNGGISAGAGSTISPGLGGSGTLTFSNNLTLNSGSISSFTLSPTINGANCQIVAAGGVTLNGGTIQISGSTLQMGRYKLILYPAGMESGSAANMTLAYSGSQNIALDDSVPGEIDLVVNSGFVTQLTWKGDGLENVWDIDTTANWLNGATPTVFTNGTAVVFNNSGSMSPAVNISATVQPLSIVVSNTAGTYTFGGGGGIAGGTGLTKQGTGGLVLSDTGGDSFEGPVVVQGGSVIFSNANVNIGGNITVSNGASLTAAQNGTLNGAFINSGAALIIGNGTLGGGIITSGTLTISNAPAISGGLTVSGGSVLLDQIPGATFTGSTVIGTNSSVQLGNNDANGILPSGAVVLNGALTFNQQASDTVSGVISGSGTLNVDMTNNDLLLSGVNTFSGNINIQGGTLSAWTASSLGTTAGIITVTNVPVGATLDHGWDATKAIIASGAGVGGNGAIVNNSSGNAIYDGSGGMSPSITLVGNTTFGGNTRWDLGSEAVLSTRGSNYNVAITSPNGTYFEWDNVAIDTNLGNIDIYGAGTSLGVKGCGGSMGNLTNTATVHAGANLTFWGEVSNNNGYAKNYYVQTNATLDVRQTVTNFLGNIALDAGGGLGIFDNSAQKNLSGRITLNGFAHFLVGDTTQTISGIISGPGGIYLDNYNNILVLTATNTYTGETLVENSDVTLALSGNGSISQSTPIVISAGTLAVTNRVDGTLTLANGQALEGAGTVKGILAAGAGSTISPGTNGNTGLLTVSGNVTLNGNSVFKLDSPTNDVLVAGGALAYGGTLTLTNISGTPLAAGDSFMLFRAGSYNGAFASISPVSPGPGLLWNTNSLAVNGTLSVVSSASPASITGISVNGPTLTITAAKGAMDGQFVLLQSTNLALPLGQWTPVLTNSFDGNGNLNLSTNIINSNNPEMFYLLEMP